LRAQDGNFAVGELGSGQVAGELLISAHANLPGDAVDRYVRDIVEQLDSDTKRVNAEA
jgi:hypothetical protein